MAAERGVVGAALVPGMPHLLAGSATGNARQGTAATGRSGDAARSWKALAEGVREVGRRLAAAKPDVVLTLSTQWFTVLGHQVQLDPRPRGHHVDENWYAYPWGHVDYDLPMDTELAGAWADAIDGAGYQARRTRYDGFPIDIGTIVARRLADPDRRIPGAQVSCNLYAPAEAMGELAALGVEVAAAQGKRVAVVVISGLSAGLIQRWITPDEDHLLTPEHDRWNKRILDLLVDGDADAVMAERAAWADAAAVDAQGRGLAFLHGAGVLDTPADLIEYGPIWGTGAAVLHWTGTER